jgi:HD-like signal output (HDOD) protein
MSVAITAQDAERQMGAAAIGGLIKDIPIPPRPIIVQQMQEEMAKSDPDMRRIAQIIAQDVGLTIAVLKTVNSPIYALSRRAESVDQAVGLIGLKQLGMLVAALALRSLLKGDSNSLGRFYDTSARRAQAMTRMAKFTGLVDVTLAQTFGLFCDVGIPLLMHRFPAYIQTLKMANEDQERSFTAIEQDAHHTDHALIGALMARTWAGQRGAGDSTAPRLRGFSGPQGSQRSGTNDLHEHPCGRSYTALRPDPLECRMEQGRRLCGEHPGDGSSRS